MECPVCFIVLHFLSVANMSVLPNCMLVLWGGCPLRLSDDWLPRVARCPWVKGANSGSVRIG